MKLHNVRPYSLEISPVGHRVILAEADSDFDVDDQALAASLLDQPDNFAPADEESHQLLAALHPEPAAAADPPQTSTDAGAADQTPSGLTNSDAGAPAADASTLTDPAATSGKED